MPTEEPKGLVQIASAEALAWIKKVGAKLGSKPTKQLSLLSAEAEVATAETAARIIAIDLAREMLKATVTAVKTGKIPAEWDRESGKGLIAAGLDKYDPRLAFQASVRTAYGAGRYERAMKSGLPFLVYRTMRDGRVRDTHAMLDGVTLPKRHPFWATHYPPNGFNCRCRVYAIDETGIGRLEGAGQRVLRDAPKEQMRLYKDTMTGETRKVPASITPGFDFNPSNNPDQLAQMLENRRRFALDAEASKGG